MSGGELTLNPAAAYFRLRAVETAPVLALTVAVAVLAFDADALQLGAALLLGALVYGAVEIFGARDSIPRGRLLDVPDDATVTDAEPSARPALLAVAVATAVALGVLSELLEGGAAFAVVPLAATQAAAVVRWAWVRRWERRYEQQVLYGVDGEGDDHLYARPQPLSIGI